MAAIPLHHGIQQAERTLTLSRLIQKKRTRNLIMFCSVVLSYTPLHSNRLNSDIYRVHLSLVTDGGTQYQRTAICISDEKNSNLGLRSHVTKVSFCCWLNEVRIRVPDHDCNRCTWWKGGMIWCRLNFLRGVLHSHVTI